MQQLKKQNNNTKEEPIQYRIVILSMSKATQQTAKSYTYSGHTTYSQGTATEQSNSITVVANHSACQNLIFPLKIFSILTENK